MTRTDLADTLLSASPQDIKVVLVSLEKKSLQTLKKCNHTEPGTRQNKTLTHTERHFSCVDKLLDYLKLQKYSMESPYRKAERYTNKPDASWNTLGLQQRFRFSAPDILSHRATPPKVAADMASKVVISEQKRRTRSKSASRVPARLTPASCSSSSRKGREPELAPEPWCRPEPSQNVDVAPWAHIGEVHLIELQPQANDCMEYSSYYVANTSEDSVVDKSATSPHVRCRVDIKPDESALHYTGQEAKADVDLSLHRHYSVGRRSLTVPRHFTYSKTPSTADSVGAGSRQGAQYPHSMMNKYMQPMEIPLHRMPSSVNYYDMDYDVQCNPNTTPQCYYYSDPRFSATTLTQPCSSFQNEHYAAAGPHHAKMQYVQDPRAQKMHPVSPRPWCLETEAYPCPGKTPYPKPYSTNKPGHYVIQTAPTRIFYGEDPSTFPIQTAPPRFCYSRNIHVVPPEHHVPAKVYYTEGRKHARVVQTQLDEFYGSETSANSSNLAAQVPQVTPVKIQHEPVSASWYANPTLESQRIGTDSKSYSRSWDNILNSCVEREQPVSVNRRQSFDDLLKFKRSKGVTIDKPQPAVVNLSSSPRRYAALSMSDNSLIDRSPSETSKSARDKFWCVTPEITITDDDILPGKIDKAKGWSSGCELFDSRSPGAPGPSQFDCKCSPQANAHEDDSLQQSLEQLDELLANLVTDYKPPSRRASKDILDQLKKLIDEEEAVSLSRKSSMAGMGEPAPLDKQPTSVRIHYDGFQDMDRASDAMKSVEECSPDQSPDEDDTMMCSNDKCRRTETLFNACLYFKSCHSCYTYYCSRNCRREDWDIHKESCLYGKIGSVCRHIIKHCRETAEVHRVFSRIAKVGYLSRGRGVVFLGFPNPTSSNSFLQYGLGSLMISPTYLSLRELASFKDNLGEYCKELQEAGKEYDPNECFILNVSIAVGEQTADGPSPRNQAPAVRKHAKVALASFSPDSNVHKKESEMETLILTPPPGTTDIDKEGEVGRKAREVCFINIQRELRIRGIFLRHEYPQVYRQLCEFVENNRRFTPTTIYPIDKRTGKQFMCMIMAASEPRTLDWVGTPHLLDDII